MKTKYTILVFGFFLLLFSNPVFSQKKILTDEEQVQEAVTQEIDTLFKSKDFLKQKNKKFADAKGTVTIDVGVVQNGKVSTFFKVDDDIKKPLFINFISDYILEHKFYFKLQKQQRYKIRYTAIFN